jgi:hypothetical protein
MLHDRIIFTNRESENHTMNSVDADLTNDSDVSPVMTPSADPVTLASTRTTATTHLRAAGNGGIAVIDLVS